MDEKSLPDLFSNLIPDELETMLGLGDNASGEQTNLLVQALKTAADKIGGPLATAVDEFLAGKGELHETTRAAITRGSGSALGDVAAALIEKFSLSSPTAKLIAGLLVKLMPALGKETAAKKKPRRKTSSSSAKSEASTHKKPRKTSAKPKPGTTKPAAKKKPKTSSSTAKPKRKTRSSTIEDLGETQ